MRRTTGRLPTFRILSAAPGGRMPFAGSGISIFAPALSDFAFTVSAAFFAGGAVIAGLLFTRKADQPQANGEVVVAA